MTAEKPSDSAKPGYGRPPEHTKWKPGVSANPGGKPTKSRNRLQGDFMRRLADDFEQHGKKAIVDMRERDPAAYIRAIATLMPKEVEITHPLDDISDDELDAAILAVRAVLSASNPGANQVTAGRAESPEVLPPVRETV